MSRQLFICYDCGGEFSEPSSLCETHYELSDHPKEWFACCPYCASPSFEEADYCEVCGEIFPLREIMDGMCQSCLAEFEKGDNYD